MKRTIVFTLAVMAMLIMASCGGTKNVNMETTKAIDPKNMDPDFTPGDDFFRYVNGGWMKANPIPPEYTQYGAFHVLFDQNQEELKKLVQEVSNDQNAEKGSISQKIRDFYNSGMDTSRINEMGISAIASQVGAISSMKEKDELAYQVAQMQKYGVNPLFYFYVAADQVNSTMNIINFYQGGLGLPDVDYYTNPDERSQKIREDYVAHITNMFLLSGSSEQEAKRYAEKVMAIEMALAGKSKTRLERRIPEENFYKVTLDQLAELSPAFDWNTYFKTFGIDEPGEINVGQKDFIAGISEVINEFNTEDWKAYLKWNLIHISAPYLQQELDKENFAFYGQILSGQQEQKPRWKRVLNNTSSGLGEAIGQLYVERYFPPESKQRMETLVENLKLAFGERIKKLDWMSDTTKKEALAKLNAITVKIGYPDKWKDYSVMEVVPDSYISNVWSANTFEFNRDLAKIGKPVDKTEWHMTPQTVNAYYNPSNNEIVFPAGILQPPFFNKDADDAVNYGAIGVVIGHEMTHGFDDRGRKYDKEGNMKDWWTQADAKRFEDKTKLLSVQYDNYAMLDSLHVDGALTMGENIADLGGLYIAYDAYQMSLNGKIPEQIDGMSGDQRFFMGYAQVWRTNIRDKELMRRLKEDVHSPGEARVNVPVFNLQVFNEAFGISSEDKLYVPEEKRALIW